MGYYARQFYAKVLGSHRKLYLNDRYVGVKPSCLSQWVSLAVSNFLHPVFAATSSGPNTGPCHTANQYLIDFFSSNSAD